jgi:hypothetical protein
LENLDTVREYERLQANKHGDKRKERCKEYYSANREKRLQQERERYALKSEQIKERAQQYRLANRDKVYAWNGTRRAQLRNAVPVWADLLEIERVYKAARRVSAETGIKHHVDHVVPLCGENVCGLHVAHNLRVVTAEENLAKSNRV